MADQVEPEGARSHDPGMESRVAVLEYIARGTQATLERLDRRLDGMAAEHRSQIDGVRLRMDALALEHRSDFRWLLGILLGGFAALLGALAGLLGAMAHGFHWL